MWLFGITLRNSTASLGASIDFIAKRDIKISHTENFKQHECRTRVFVQSTVSSHAGISGKGFAL
jgi:hypothetical protein